jgi:large subunit ribosomal protein L5e
VKERRPFKAVLDVGLVRTTTGNRVFGALKGAVDGGIYIPHNTKRFAGYHIVQAAATTSKKGKVLEKGKSSGSFNPKEHRDHIFGLHVQAYMDKLKKDNKESYKKRFAKWDACITKNKVQNLEALYKKLHADIRKSPKKTKTERK